MNTPLVALCVGHSRKINGRTEGGAISVDGTSEHAFNKDLAARIHQALRGLDIAAIVEDEYQGAGYGSAQAWLAKYLQERSATLAVELHFNASEGQARGHEWLYWSSSANGKRLAECLRSEFQVHFPGQPDRGIKPKASTDRGSEFLRGTHCPAVICEPFFGDNATDWKIFSNRRNDLANTIAQGIAAYLTK